MNKRAAKKAIFDHLRLEFAKVIIDGMSMRDWNFKDLAKQSGVDETIITRFVTLKGDMYLNDMGKILHALEARVQIVLA